MANILKSYTRNRKNNDLSSAPSYPSPQEDLSSLSKKEGIKLSITSLNACFGTKLTLKNVDIGFKENCVTALIGPSGCGKTTL
ncbi:MAG: hypothetical protein ACTHKJ_08535, partial [Candidatus Nitrosocosmicus sp.]